MRKTVQQLRDRSMTMVQNLFELATTGRTADRLWQLVWGDGTTEESEVYGPLGYAARPASRGAKVFTLRPRAGSQPITIAVHDPDPETFPVLAEDERALYNDGVVIHLLADGTVEIRSHGGTAVPLATKADVQALRDYVRDHFHQYSLSGSPTPTSVPITGTATPISPPTTANVPSSPNGTTVLKGE